MASATFVTLSGAIVEAMGQRMDAAKPTPEGLALRTSDGFLYSFIEDPNTVSLETVQRLLGGEGTTSARLVVLTPGHLPLAIAQEVVGRSGTLVEGARFAELARQLGLETYLGQEPRPPPREARRLLPSAQQLDGIVHRARAWLDWGVPALALRFYRQAAELKPGFLPAKVGVGRALLGLGLADDAERAFDEVLALRPDDVEARLGKGAVLGARGRPKEEVAVYRKLLAEDEGRNEVRAHLLAALIDLGDWSGARTEIEALLAKTPEEPQLRFLHAIALSRTGEKGKGDEERLESRRLGLSFDQETSLCRHLGLPAPEPPAAESAPSTPAATPVAPRTARPRARARPAKAPAADRRRAVRSTAANSRSSRPRKRK